MQTYPPRSSAKKSVQAFRWRRLVLLALAGGVAIYCSGDHSASAPAPSNPKASPMPAALRAAYLQARQKEATADHAIQTMTSQPATLTAKNSLHGLDASFGPQGLGLRSSRRPDLPAVALTLKHYGCAEAPESAAPTAPRLGNASNRVEYAHKGVREWYVNGPLGLEHGYTVDKDLGCGGEGRLVFALALEGGLDAKLAGEGSTTRLELRDPKAPKSAPVLMYSDLFALDADGKELPARMLYAEQTVRLEVDAAGARYPVTVDPTWTEQQKLTSSDGVANDNFGNSVAVSGDTAVVGAINHNAGRGEAYVYVRSGTTWTEQQKLIASDGAANDNFGNSVAVSGDTAVVGAPNKTVGANTFQGQAYVYVRSGTMWTEQRILTASDGASPDSFGYSVAVSGDTAVVGAPAKTVGANTKQGEAYVYVRSGTTWTEQKILTASDGAQSDRFGFSVAVSGDTAVVGAYQHQVGGNVSQGEAYVYVRSGTTWTEQQKLTSSDGTSSDQFGLSVAVSGDTAVVGANLKLVGATHPGEAYVYVRSGTTWAEQQKLIASDGADSDNFGWTVAVSGDTAVVGAPFKTVGTNAAQGEAYVYVRSGTTWTEQQKLIASDGTTLDFFGQSVAVDQATATLLVGAPGHMVSGHSAQGQAYVYVPPNPNGTPCTIGSTCASTFCADGVCCDAACGNSNDMDCQACSAAKKASGTGDGTCGAAKATVVCRAAADVCDTPASCDGSTTVCPANGFKSGSTQCRMAAGVCDMPAKCTGSSAACPANGFLSNTTICRASAGVCDVQDKCTGSSAACPMDAKQSPGFSCGTAPYMCGATPCICEKPGVCDGSTNACGASTLYQLSDMHVCRAAVTGNDCSVNSYCDGTGPGCHILWKAAGTKCNKTVGGSPMCGKCNSSGVCLAPFSSGVCM